MTTPRPLRRAGFDPEAFRAGVRQLHGLADQYATYGHSTAEAIAWANAGFLPDEAADWRLAGFGPAEAAALADGSARYWPTPQAAAQVSDEDQDQVHEEQAGSDQTDREALGRLFAQIAATPGPSAADIERTLAELAAWSDNDADGW